MFDDITKNVLLRQPMKKDGHLQQPIACYEGRKEMFYLMTHSTHFIYGYMASDIW